MAQKGDEAFRVGGTDDGGNIIPPLIVLKFLKEATQSLRDCQISCLDRRLDDNLKKDDDDNDHHSNPQDLPSFPLSLQEVQQFLLQVQTKCLSRTVSIYNSTINDHRNSGNDSRSIITVEQVQVFLKCWNDGSSGNDTLLSPNDIDAKKVTKEIEQCMSKMNDTARLAFGQLVLYSECVRNSNNSRKTSRDDRALKTSGTMSRPDLLEFIGLCDVVVRLSNVRDYVVNGKSYLYPQIQFPAVPKQQPGNSVSDNIFPHKRLEYVQQLLLQAVGYESKFGYSEIKRIFFSPNLANEYSHDTEVIHHFSNMAMDMDQLVREATMQATISGLGGMMMSDYDQGGVTRVVSVQYSEKEIDPTTGKEITTEDSTNAPDNNNASSAAVGAEPKSQSMDKHLRSDQQQGDESEQQQQQQQRKEREIVKQTAQLEQEIWHELLTMRDEVRDAKLQDAKAAQVKFLQKLQQIPTATERIQYIQSIDIRTQRLLLMDKLWTSSSSIVQKNNGKPPNMYSG